MLTTQLTVPKKTADSRPIPPKRKNIILRNGHFKIFVPAVADMIDDLHHDRWMTSQSISNYLDWREQPHGMHQLSLPDNLEI